MEPAKEERKLVTSISELKIGKMVVDIRCECGKQHRALVIDEGVEVDENDRELWRCFEVTGCGRPLEAGVVDIIDADMVAQGRIYLVNDGLDPESDLFEDAMDARAAQVLADAVRLLRKTAEKITGQQS